ncbi:hypothetical protein [Jiangella endophytica]|uniref:hypothetical protein n=1 Tax=Jiangella endophytica TaxID=1623398 RepID=UPI000E346188|nr:hypothetical protein [Jiangella endophytica]
MSDTAPQQRRRNVIAVAAAVVVVALAVVVAVWLTSDSDDDPGDGSVAVPSDAAASSTPSAEGTFIPGQEDVLTRAMSGQDAVDALGDRLGDVAELNGMSADELRDLLLRDSSVVVTPSGRLLYDDQMTPPPTSE